MNISKKNIFVYNAIILVAVSLIMRTVGIYFNVYISNKVGAEAMGVHSLICGVYNFSITLATSGINLAVTRLISEAQGKNRPDLRKKIMSTCLTYALIFGGVAAGLLFSMSEIISYRWLDDARCITPLRILALSLPCIACTSAINGYFTAIRNVVKNAFTVFFEQTIRISLTVVLLTTVLPSGIEYACIALALGSLAAEICSLIILALLYIFQKKQRVTTTLSCAPPLITKSLLNIALPVAFSAYIRSGLLTLEHALIPLGLKKYGMDTATSLSLYGTLQSMALPVVLFPAVFITSFAGLLIPEISESRSAGDITRVKNIQRKTLRLTLLFAIGVSGIMLCFAKELGSALYPNIPESARFIALLAPLIPIMYLDSMTDVMLKGMGQQFYSMLVNIGDALLSVILVGFLLPRYGIYSYIVIIYICELINATLSVSRLMYVSKIKLNIRDWILKPLAAVIGSVSILRLMLKAVSTDFTIITLIYAIILCIIVYIILLWGLYSVEKKDFIKIKQLLTSTAQ